MCGTHSCSPAQRCQSAGNPHMPSQQQLQKQQTATRTPRLPQRAPSSLSKGLNLQTAQRQLLPECQSCLQQTQSCSHQQNLHPCLLTTHGGRKPTAAYCQGHRLCTSSGRLKPPISTSHARRWGKSSASDRAHMTPAQGSDAMCRCCQCKHDHHNQAADLLCARGVCILSYKPPPWLTFETAALIQDDMPQQLHDHGVLSFRKWRRGCMQMTHACGQYSRVSSCAITEMDTTSQPPFQLTPCPRMHGTQTATHAMRWPPSPATPACSGTFPSQNTLLSEKRLSDLDLHSTKLLVPDEGTAAESHSDRAKWLPPIDVGMTAAMALSWLSTGACWHAGRCAVRSAGLTSAGRQSQQSHRMSSHRMACMSCTAKGCERCATTYVVFVKPSYKSYLSNLPPLVRISRSGSLLPISASVAW